jgi:Uncharacterized conserved protein
MRGFLLGLTSGTICLAYCAPVLVPYLLGEGSRVKQNYLELALFLSGRLLGYLIFALMAWALGFFIVEHQVYRELIFGTSYIVLAGLLVYYCFRKSAGLCAAEHFKKFWPGLSGNQHFFLPVLLGFLTGLNLCPPLLLAFTNAARAGSLWSSLIFFAFFFLGTTVFFMPMPFLGLLKRNEILRSIGKMAAGVIGSYYFYSGVFIVMGVIKRI